MDLAESAQCVAETWLLLVDSINKWSSHAVLAHLGPERKSLDNRIDGRMSPSDHGTTVY